MPQNILHNLTVMKEAQKDRPRPERAGRKIGIVHK